MGGKRLSEVIEYEKHIKPYRIIEFVSGVGSGKNYWVENVLMEQMRVLLITSRKAKVEEAKSRTGINNCLNISQREKNALEYFLSENKKDGSCICSNWQIEYYMNHQYISGNEKTYLWQFFDIIVLDEAHSLATDATYTDAPFYVLDFIRGVYKQSNIPIILMTATHIPIDGLLNVKNKTNYHYWDFTKECRNLLPDKLWYQTTEQTLREIVRFYKLLPNNNSKWIYFATRTSTIANKIVPYLVKSGIPEEEIAVSFSKDEAKAKFSDIIQKNKEKVEEYLKTNEDIPKDIKIFITTSRNKEGINIDNPNYYWNIAIESHWTDEVAQMWGRVRHGLNQHGNENKPATNKVVIVYDAPQHSKFNFRNDFSAILSKECADGVNTAFNHWCKQKSLPLINRIHNNETKKKIKEIILQFPYLRYGFVNDKFYIYKGKILGQQSFARSVDNFKAYVSGWLGKPTTEQCVAPFLIKSFLIMPSKRIDTFEDYVGEKGFLNGKSLSRQEQKDMLDFISDVLMVRQKSDVTKPYKSLAKAVTLFGYALKSCSHHKENKLYGHYKLIKIATEETGGVFSDSI